MDLLNPILFQRDFSPPGWHGGDIPHLQQLEFLTGHILGTEAAKELGLHQEWLQPLMEPLEKHWGGLNSRHSEQPLPQTVHENQAPLQGKGHPGKLEAQKEEKSMNSREF